MDDLIPTGLTLFCGAQKIGKSWLMLKLCLCVLEGRSLWELPTTPGDVLYLCLEDTFYCIQDRLFRLADEASERLRFAVASSKLTDGLIAITLLSNRKLGGENSGHSPGRVHI